MRRSGSTLSESRPLGRGVEGLTLHPLPGSQTSFFSFFPDNDSYFAFFADGTEKSMTL